MLARLPAILLRAEGAVLFAAALWLYLDADHGVVLLLALFLAPDLSFAAYLAGPRIGALVYNSVHTLVWPLGLGAAGVVAGEAALEQVALIWLAHIGLDRMLGYGLKYPTAFEDTHLHRV